MGVWGDHAFESDSGLDVVYATLRHLLAEVERLACGPWPRGSSLHYDALELAANVEIVALVARAAYKAAMFVPVRGMLLPDPEVVAGWKEQYLAHWERLGRWQVEGSAAERRRYGLEAAAPLDRLAKLSREQRKRQEAAHREAWVDVVAARLRQRE
jgi:hypothetical protein